MVVCKFPKQDHGNIFKVCFVLLYNQKKNVKPESGP